MQVRQSMTVRFFFIYRNLLGLRFIRSRIVAKSGVAGDAESGAPIETSVESAASSSHVQFLNVFSSSAVISN